MAQILEPVAKPKAVIPNHPRRHRVPPTNVLDRNAEGRRQSLTLVGTRSPATNRDRFNSFALQLGPLGDFFDRQAGFLKQQINGADRQDDLPSVWHDAPSRDLSREATHHNARRIDPFPEVASLPL